MDIDKRRFRANFYVEWDNQDDAFFEQTLVGKTLKIGDHLELMIVERDPRCMMITFDPDTGESNPEVLKRVVKGHDGKAGIYGAVLVEGTVRPGDEIKLLS